MLQAHYSAEGHAQLLIFAAINSTETEHFLLDNLIPTHNHQSEYKSPRTFFEFLPAAIGGWQARTDEEQEKDDPQSGRQK